MFNIIKHRINIIKPSFNFASGRSLRFLDRTDNEMQRIIIQGGGQVCESGTAAHEPTYGNGNRH